jgi:ABC-type multidrug transport system fused ATPase/permease subunit
MRILRPVSLLLIFNLLFYIVLAIILVIFLYSFFIAITCGQSINEFLGWFNRVWKKKKSSQAKPNGYFELVFGSIQFIILKNKNSSFSFIQS